ncbi:MAG: VOC family protein [Proteobacteria bacterium]|nr:VOC family protein [Desulfobacula sp.]MBU3951657.1 VOC family protein [Pseudomonadota bacterium]MBU4132996.1 VOC family protein [Pseudomonadota bacterium]
MKINAVNTILYCNQWKETVDFYAIGLNLRVLLDREWFVEFRLTDSARLSIADARRTTVKSNGGSGITISLRVDNLQSAHMDFQQRNLNPTPIRPLWGSMVFYLYDPEGNRLEFWS